MTRRKILINGGGIAGLTAALCLAKSGNNVSVFERASELEPLGAGIQISPNAFHVLSDLGLGEELIAAGDVPNAIIMMNANKGTKLATIPLGFDVHDKYGAPYIVIHRADLQNILLKACNDSPDISLKFGSEITDAAIHKNGITALIQSDAIIAEEVGDLLVGADGVGSRIRTDILKLKKAKYSGKTAWRALIPTHQIGMQDALDNTVVWLGSKAHCVTYPVRRGEFLNVIAVTQEAAKNATNAIARKSLKGKLAHWSTDFTDLLECDVDWSGWPLLETTSVKTMVVSTVALIGDAAHAMLPFAAQGAAQAIEDAHVLAKSLSDTKDVETALKQFERQRLPRVQRVAATARSNGRMYHLSGFPAKVRNLGLSKIPGKQLLQKQDWIYRWKPAL